MSEARTQNERTLPLLSTLKSKSKSWDGCREVVSVVVDMDMSSSFFVMGDVAGGRVVVEDDRNVDVGSADVSVAAVAGCAVDLLANSARSAVTISSASCNRLAIATICDMGGGFSYRHVSLYTSHVLQVGWLPSHLVLRARQLAHVRPRWVRLTLGVVDFGLLLEVVEAGDTGVPPVPAALRPAMVKVRIRVGTETVCNVESQVKLQVGC